jgi:signal transduction histidine kinase
MKPIMLAPKLPPGMDQVLVVVCIMIVLGIFLEWFRRRFMASDGVLKDVLDQIGRGVLVIDHTGKIVFWNAWLTKHLGVERELAMNSTLADLRRFAPQQEILGRLEAGIPLCSGQKPTFFQHGELVGFVQRLTLDGFSDPWLFVTINLAERLSAAHEVMGAALGEPARQAPGEMELDKLKSAFLAICSHELKTPLVSISGYLDLMNTEKLGPLSEKQKNAIAVSLKNASRLNALLTSILDFARMEAGKLQFDLVPQRIHGLLDEVASVIVPMAAARNVVVNVAVSPELPPAMMDVSLIHRAVLNLADNAVKFTPANGSVTLKAWENDDQIWLEVADSGIGIPDDKQAEIQEPFFQVDSSNTRRTGGIGLGLAIVDKILRGHGTRLIVDSKPQSGTRMRFALAKSRKSPSGKWQAVVLSPKG